MPREASFGSEIATPDSVDFGFDSEARSLLDEKSSQGWPESPSLGSRGRLERPHKRKSRLIWLICCILGVWGVAYSLSRGQSWPVRPQESVLLLARDDYQGRTLWRELFSGRRPVVREHHTLKRTGRQTTAVVPESVCVVAIDSRPLDLNIAPDGHLYSAASTVSQMSWALRHGYQYRRLGANSGWTSVPHWPTWDKVPAFRDVVKACQWSVFMDSDLFVHDAQWSLDDMRLKWGIHDGVSMFAANDPPFSEGETNTGFIIAQRTPKTLFALEKLMSCIEENEECKEYAFKPRHEQTAFERFIVHKYFTEGEDFIRGNCNEANGYWLYEHSPEVTCDGKIFAHAWGWKYDISKDTRPLYGMDLMRVLLGQFQSFPELRRQFSSLSNFRLQSREAELVAEMLSESDLSRQPVSIGSASAIAPESVCVVAVDGREVDDDVLETRAGQPFEVDGTMATSYLQLAYALRHGYQYRRIALPAFPEHPDSHAYWRSISPLIEAAETCQWTMYFAQASYPLDLHSGIEDLLHKWAVPATTDLTAFRRRENASEADLGFLLIKNTPRSLEALNLLNNCQQSNDCLPEDQKSWDHLNRVFNGIIRPRLSATSVHVVPVCGDADAGGQNCNSQFYTPRDPGWHANIHWYLQWSQDVSEQAARILGTAVQRYLIKVWQSYSLREEAFVVA